VGKGLNRIIMDLIYLLEHIYLFLGCMGCALILTITSFLSLTQSPNIILALVFIPSEIVIGKEYQKKNKNRFLELKIGYFATVQRGLPYRYTERKNYKWPMIYLCHGVGF